MKLDLTAKGFALRNTSKRALSWAALLKIQQMANVKNEDDAKAIKRKAVDAFGSNGDGGFASGSFSAWCKVSSGWDCTPNQISSCSKSLTCLKKDIALMFGVSLSMIGDADGAIAWGSGVEQMYTVNLINNVSAPIVIQVEQEV
jgi:hypothetical protein